MISAPTQVHEMAGRGLAFVPCHTGTKSAVMDVHLAASDPDRLDRWAWQHRGCNWGIAARESNLAFVDLDRRPGFDGLRNFCELLDSWAEAWPNTTATASVTPGSGHLWFSRPAGELVGRTLAPGVTMIVNGYVMAPGSVVNGRRYELVVETHLRPLLPPIAERCQPAPPDERRMGGWFGRDPIAWRTLQRGAAMIRAAQGPGPGGEPGERNPALNRAGYWAGGLAGAGRLDANAAEAVLTKAALDAGLDLAEIHKTLRAALERGRRVPLR